MQAHSPAVDLARDLIRQRTINPPGGEQICADHLRTMLQDEGFTVASYEFAPARTSLVARLGCDDALPLCFTGHLDTVPLGTVEWQHDPLGATIADGRLYGRGSSDMKSGVAAFVAAALREKERIRSESSLVLVLTAGEETGCEGAAHLLGLGDVLGQAGAVVVAEPTANRPLVGHKGALWLRALSTGVSAHGSMPEKGVNAIYRGTAAVAKLMEFGFNIAPHPVLGSPTLSVGTFSAGSSINVVPDRVEIGIDVRTIPGMGHTQLQEALARYLAADVDRLDAIVDLEHVWTDPEHPWIGTVAAMVAARTGVSEPTRGASFFTDACVLQKQYLGAPFVVLGPGQPEMAHQTDEYCVVERINEAVDIYATIIGAWCDRRQANERRRR